MEEGRSELDERMDVNRPPDADKQMSKGKRAHGDRDIACKGGRHVVEFDQWS